ncbi:MerR family transcriptional regulator [Gorillibacterium sp. CAU 1737]|uniref:MerR family transcriptional regulator n=1 Tax=Gorillibacterium sp. CAU 1737 TaxID=3140362 RepID=UPI00325FE8BB
MLMHELCKECGLTKKAIHYYLEQGLLSAEKDESGYYRFTTEDAIRLREVALLRKLGAGIPIIRQILDAENKEQALRGFREQVVSEFARRKAQEEVIAFWLDHPDDIERARRYAEETLDESLSVGQRLTLAFPGSYGLLLRFHFGSFLLEPLRTDQQKQAYTEIVSYLDQVEAAGFPEDLARELEAAFEGLTEDDLKAIMENRNRQIEHVDTFLQETGPDLSAYIAYQQTEEFRSSPAYRLQQQLTAFQQATGYKERFLANLCILSPSYQVFCEQMAAANEKLLEMYPEAKNLI